MAWLENILLPVDFSDRSLGAARYAASVAAHFHSTVTLIHVLQPPHYEFAALEVGGPMLSDLFSQRQVQVKKELDEFAPDAFAGIPVCRVLAEGDPALRVVEYAHDHHMDLIVIPTHGYGPFRRFILGSVTAKVLHDADCPVWTGVHLEQAPAVARIPFHSVICAIDLGAHSGKVFQWACRMAQEFGARLTLVNATPCASDRAHTPDPAWRETILKQAREEIDKLAPERPANCEVVIEGGDPPTVVRSAAEKRHADLLVIGRGSAAGVFGRLRTNAYALIRESPCPVVSV